MKRMIGFLLLLVVLLLGAVVVAPSMSVSAEAGPFPDPPVNLNATEVQQTSVVLGWTNETEFNDVTLVLFWREFGGSWELIPQDPASESQLLSSLTCGTQYEFFLQVEREEESIVYSNDSVTETFQTLQCGTEDPVPYAPSGLFFSDVGENSVRLDWFENSQIEEYVVVQKEFAPGQFQRYDLPANSQGVDITDLVCNSIYGFFVQTLNIEAGVEYWSEGSNYVNVETLACTPDLNPPVILPEETVMQRNSLQVHWIDTNDDPNEDRHVVWYRTLDTEDYLSVEVAANVTVATLPDLQCNTDYSLSVYAYQGNDHFDSEWIMATTSGCVNAPGNIGAIDVGADFIEIGWVDTNDDPFNEDRHVIWYREVGTEEYFSVEFEPNSESGMITGLKPDTEYSVSVFAYIGEERASSDWMTVKTEKWQIFLPVIRS